MKCALSLPTLAALSLALVACTAAATAAEDLWALAKSQAASHRFSTLFDAQDVSKRLSSEEGLQKAMDWCKKTAVTKVYIESFRDGYQAEKATLENTRKRFLEAGFIASGCITPTAVGKPSTGWKSICCYTDKPTQEKLRSIFEYTAAMFDEIMIDDFWFTDCSCPDCDAARKSKTVAIGEKQYPVGSDTWEDYRCELMVRMSRDYVLAASKKVNPNVKLIIKYPQWYDRFHERGYEVARESADFDRIWVGTETRNYADKRWGGTPQYEAYFIMRWLGGIGGEKCGGGWFDPFGTTEATYLEQARQTVLAGAAESMLFCYGALQRDTGPKNVEAIRVAIPELLQVAKEVRSRKIVGLAAYKPANSHPEKEQYVFDCVGMLGLPLVPCHEFPAGAPAAFFSIHAMKDPQLASKLEKFIAAGKPVLLTDGLAKALGDKMKLDRANVHVLGVKQDPKSLLDLDQAALDLLRAPLLKPFQADFKAPNKVGLYLFADGSWVVENFNDSAIIAELNGEKLEVPPRQWRYSWR
jgi:hypothetical protein